MPQNHTSTTTLNAVDTNMMEDPILVMHPIHNTSLASMMLLPPVSPLITNSFDTLMNLESPMPPSHTADHSISSSTPSITLQLNPNGPLEVQELVARVVLRLKSMHDSTTQPIQVEEDIADSDLLHDFLDQQGKTPVTKLQNMRVHTISSFKSITRAIKGKKLKSSIFISEYILLSAISCPLDIPIFDGQISISSPSLP